MDGGKQMSMLATDPEPFPPQSRRSKHNLMAGRGTWSKVLVFIISKGVFFEIFVPKESDICSGKVFQHPPLPMLPDTKLYTSSSKRLSFK